eukprot:CAMPEP_0170790850 /NCGR_PEP_ID=MMETSP0733-20121128/20754_1 /TAXON_ID=186038 /ORGANISM="Fragilariopsis kerguelensis, Strain L26-C5" /LENGTH=374 /DNA_ID=CAMNT_0011138587 /DNA_START=46 /DNA_END=1170 /DNA_ORIENTATION=-
MTTMIPVSSSNKRSSRGTPPRNSRIVQSRSKTDVIERFFSWSETTFCPHHTGKIPFSQADGRKDEDMLEYVFDNVESFTCAAPPLTDRNGKQPVLADKRNSNSNNTSNNNTNTHYLNEDENSLVEEGQVPLQGRPRRAVRHSGDDMLDYCFDHVESLVCTEGNEALVLAPIPNVPRVSTLGSYSEAGRRLMPKKKQRPTTAERVVVNNTTNGHDKNKKLSAKLQKRRAKAAIEEQLHYLSGGKKNQPPELQQKGRKQTAAIEAQLDSSQDRDKQDHTTTTTMSTQQRGNWFDGISRISTSKKKAMKHHNSSIIVNTLNDDRSESIPYHISTTTPTSSRPTVVAAPRPVTPPHNCYHEEEDLQLYFRPIRNTTSF